MLHDGTATPMALVISLCGVLTVSISVLTRRAQARRDVQAQTA
ncbi:Bcr/CflA family multidrug resistance transporter [Pseudomonas syringae pv. actinidiae ICMP 19079]|nr:Bcr/CflA family multidrug resistance transporter [Pseudomonas syringae pv. actinidiae ICMP 19079]